MKFCPEYSKSIEICDEVLEYHYFSHSQLKKKYLNRFRDLPLKFRYFVSNTYLYCT